MKITNFVLAAVCATVAMATPAVSIADVITFNTNPDNTYWVTPISSDGFTFSDTTGQGSLGTARNLDGSSVDNGTVHLMDWVNGGSLSTMRMQASDNSLFSLSSFDFTSGYLSGSAIANQLTVTGYDAGNNVIANAVFTSAAYSNLTFTNLSLNSSFQNLQYVIFQATGNENRVGYDNFLVNAAAVPEPASMLAWGLIAGVGAVGYRLRKRKAAVVA